MIVLSSALQASSRTLRHPRICYESRTLGLSASAVTVSSESAGGPKDAPLRPDTAEYWEPLTLPATWEVDLGSLGNVDYVGIGAHTLGSSGCSVVAEVSDGTVGSPSSDKVWSTVESAAPVDDFPILLMDVPTSSRHMRLTVVAGSPAFIPRIGVIFVGQSLEFEAGVGIAGGFAPPNLSRKTDLHASLSNSGQFLGQGFKRKGVTADVSVAGMTPEWYRSTFDPFVKHARSYPYFFAWNPLDFDDDVVFGWTSRDIVPRYIGVDPYFQVSWQITGTGHD
jgi:hypothetical protein